MIAVYDACVLHDPALRDLLIRLARKPGLDIQAKWSEQILDEMVRSIAERRPDLDPARLERTRELMCEAIRDSLVIGHMSLVDELELPDPDDRHVLAAAIHARAEVIVTFNLHDFPLDALDRYGIEAEHPDDFVLQLLDVDAPSVIAAVVEQSAALTRPPQTVPELLDSLASRTSTYSASDTPALPARWLFSMRLMWPAIPPEFCLRHAASQRPTPGVRFALSASRAGLGVRPQRCGR